MIIETLQQHRDDRGAVFEPLDADTLRRQRNAHVVLTGPGHIRGNHYHLRGTETMAVRGPALVRWRRVAEPEGEPENDGRESRDHPPPDEEIHEVDVPDGDVVVFRFPAGVAHAIRNIGEGEGLIVCFRDVEHDPTGSDTVRAVLIRPRAEPPDPS